MAHLKWLSLLGLLGMALATPVPQEINRDAEIVPEDTPLKSDSPTPFVPPRRRHFIAVRPISLGDILGGGQGGFPFVVRRRIPSTVGSQDPIFGSPSFVDVPAEDADGSTDVTESGGTSPLHRVFEDMIKIQRDLIGSLFSPATRTGGQRPVRIPLVPDTDAESSDIPVESVPDVERVPVERRPGHSFISQLFPGIFPGAASDNPFRFPNFGDLPADFDNSTYKEEEIDGQIVRVNETIKKTSTPFGSSVFHFKVYSLKPDGTEETIEDVEIPDEVVQAQLPSETPETSEPEPEVQVEVQEQEQEQEQVPFKEDFGGVVVPQTEGNGAEEPQFSLPALDESLNEIPQLQ